MGGCKQQQNHDKHVYLVTLTQICINSCRFIKIVDKISSNPPFLPNSSRLFLLNWLVFVVLILTSSFALHVNLDILSKTL